MGSCISCVYFWLTLSLSVSMTTMHSYGNSKHALTCLDRAQKRLSWSSNLNMTCSKQWLLPAIGASHLLAIWYDMSEMTWHDVIGMMWCDVTWRDLTWYEMTWYDMIQVEPRKAGGGSFQVEGLWRHRIQRQGLPIGTGVKPHIFSTLFCDFVLILPHPFSLWPHFSALRSSSQTISALLNFHNSFQQLSKFFTPSHLSTLFASSPLFSTLLNDSRLGPPLLNSSQLISTLLTSCHLFSTLPTASHLRSLSSTFSAHLSSCHLLPACLNSCQLF